MKHLLVWLLLSSLCSLSSWGIRDMLVVIQSPHNVTVTEGDSVQIQCCWNQNVPRGTVHWHKEGHIEIKYKSVLVNNSQCHDRASQQTVACNCSNWTISNITRNYTGTYICKVSLEIPSLIESVGNGTRITVTFQNTTNNGEFLRRKTAPAAAYHDSTCCPATVPPPSHLPVQGMEKTPRWCQRQNSQGDPRGSQP
ncbi:unnamed protein product [Oncorhynchus mykiss]|uniref:Ig-like domain-containing protein n=1 Tax=Oncorhynchus mykiss TaxID=8022 RepID=A0A060Y023_ONCMY|nr:unnamed protein product [Oncorhynchus mykiss]